MTVPPENGGPEDHVRKIVQAEGSKVARRSFLLYLANAVIAMLAASLSSLFFGSFLGSSSNLIVQGSVATVTTYALLVYYTVRSRPSRNSGAHCYAAGLLGLSLGGLLFVWGGYQFLSVGYWLRQGWRPGPAKCGSDGGEVVAFGQGSLACTKGSHLVAIGWDLPRTWTLTGSVALVVGIPFIALRSYIPEILLNSPVLLSQSLLIIGLVFVLGPLLRRTYFEGHVRLPPSQTSRQN